MTFRNKISKLISRIDRDKVIQTESSPDEIDYYHNHPKYHDVVNLTCTHCNAPKLYRVGTDTDYTLHCYSCDKIEHIVSL